MKFEKITPHTGSMLSDIGDCSVLGSHEIQQIKDEVMRRHVVFIPKQNLSAASLLSFARHFGTPLAAPHPKFGNVDGIDEVSLVINDKDNPPDINVWHSDLSFLERPASFCLLLAQELPPSGGDTLWSSLTAAYDALSAPMKNFLKPLTAYHQLPLDGYPPLMIQSVLDKPIAAEHALIRHIPETDRLSLFINRVYTHHVTQLNRQESQGLLAGLFAHCESPDFQLRHTWQVGDLAIWDNRAALHFASADYFPHRRVMHRVAIDGLPVQPATSSI